MSEQQTLILMTREGCHLCDQVAMMMDLVPLNWRPVDIAADPGLERTYGLRIPVLRHPGSGRELDYPFTAEQALELAAGNPRHESADQ